jgi:hypothetical protein
MEKPAPEHTYIHTYKRWVGHVARMGPKKNSYRILVGKPGGKMPLGRPRRRCEINTRHDELGETGVGL